MTDMTTHTPRKAQLEQELYLLRVWYEPTDAQPAWRASLSPPRGAPRRHFATRSALLAYLTDLLTGEGTDADTPVEDRILNDMHRP